MEIENKKYLDQKGISYIERGAELITKCIFSNCDSDSRASEAHLYINKETGQYQCKKCGAKGNMITFARYLGDTFLPEQQNKIVSTNRAKMIWEHSVNAPVNFPYLQKKKISPHGSKLYKHFLVLPLFSTEGHITSLQFVDPNGEKKFLAGGKTVGSYFLLGEPKGIICIAEGFATAASIREATGYTTAIAFSSGNLKQTAVGLKKRYPDVDIIICGDTDPTGMQKAHEAAETIGVKLALPVFNQEEKIGGKNPSDFNDLAILRGNQSVVDCLNEAKFIPSKYGFVSLGALLDEPDEVVAWVTEGLLPSGGFSIVVAKPKVGKSTIVRQLALAVTRGESFLGRQTTKGGVLYVSLEEKKSEVKKHFRQMGATGIENLGIYVGSTPEDAHEWLKKEIESKKPVLVIIDTLFRFARVNDLNDYAKVISALDPLLDLARTQSAHLMCLHHARKSTAEGADATLGSTAIFGSVDTAIILKKSDGKRTIETQQRYGEDMEPTVLVFESESKTVVLGGTKEEDDVQKVSESIMGLLKLKNEPVKETIICDEIEGRTVVKRLALRKLVTEFQIIRTGGGRRGDPYFYSCSLVPDIDGGRENKNSNL